MKKRIKNQLQELPKAVGIYKFYNKEGKVLYIGKALNLRTRVGSYFKKGHDNRPHIIPMIPKIYNIETIKTENEIDALILEAALIKKYQPKYNVMMKDDKSYSWIYISTEKEIPQVQVVRSLSKEDYKKGKLFGPYPKGSAVRRIFTYLRNLYPFCACKNEREEKKYYEMGLCPGPQIGKISIRDYRKKLNKLIKFLEGDVDKPVKTLKGEMKSYADNLNFEKAAEIRDRISDLEYLTQKINADAFETEEGYKKKIRKKRKSEVELLSKELDKCLDINVPKLERIECYDISNIQGKYAYGSMVVALDGKLRNDHYRAFKIKTVKQANDYKMLYETLSRRLKHIGRQSEVSLGSKPDLILIDGGKGQISKLAELIPSNVILLGISKGRKYKRKGARKRNEFWSRDGEQIHLKNTKILVRLRDESHRFAIKYYRNRHRKELFS